MNVGWIVVIVITVLIFLILLGLMLTASFRQEQRDRVTLELLKLNRLWWTQTELWREIILAEAAGLDSGVLTQLGVLLQDNLRNIADQFKHFSTTNLISTLLQRNEQLRELVDAVLAGEDPSEILAQLEVINSELAKLLSELGGETTEIIKYLERFDQALIDETRAIRQKQYIASVLAQQMAEQAITELTEYLSNRILPVQVQ